MVHPQRVREGESRAETQVAKWTAEGAVKGPRWLFVIRLSILRREAYVSCREYDGISQRAQVILWSKVAPRVILVLGRNVYSAKDVFILPETRIVTENFMEVVIND